MKSFSSNSRPVCQHWVDKDDTEQIAKVTSTSIRAKTSHTDGNTRNQSHRQCCTIIKSALIQDSKSET